jgi:hypothetical protein
MNDAGYGQARTSTPLSGRSHENADALPVGRTESSRGVHAGIKSGGLDHLTKLASQVRGIPLHLNSTDQ